MAELVHVDLDVLPRDPAFRPVERQAYWSRRVPLAVGLGIGLTVLGTQLWPFPLWAVATWVAGVATFRRRKAQEFARDGYRAHALLLAGEYEAAESMFDRLCARSRGMPTLHCVYVCKRAEAHLARGEYPQAVSLLSAVVYAGWLASAVTYPVVLGRLALALALDGRLDEATAWRARAHAAIDSASRGALLLCDVVVSARQGRFAEAVDIVDDGWVRAESLLHARERRATRLVQAFALEQRGGDDYRAPARADDGRRALDSVREGRPGELRALGEGWPALLDFMTRHHLVAAAAPSAARAP